MSHAILGMFNDAASAATAKQQLIAAGIPASAITSSPAGNVSQSSGTTTNATSTTGGTEDRGFWASVKEMFGADEDSEGDRHVSYYSEGARRGGVVLSVDATEAQADKVADVLNGAGAVDVDEKAAEWEKTGWKAPAALATTTKAATTATTARAASTADVAGAAGKIDLVKEELAVGKRVVNRGGVRIVKKIISKPVSESVQLREEHVSVDRRVIDRPLTGAETADAFKEGTIELTESGEEAVAAKTTRVVGEVVVGKTATERTETVKDNLRETDVQVEQLPGQAVSSTSKTTVEPVTTTKTTTTKTGV